MKKNNIHGKLILTSSIYSLAAQDKKVYNKTKITNNIAYSLVKSSINIFVKNAAVRFGGDGIRINSIAPGSIATERQSKLWLNSKFKKEILKKQCLSRQLLPQDVSKMVLYLASDISSGCTKQNFTVDGGLT